ncbi:MAG: hypothetical protein UX27_C0002G0023 [Candidatus Azambacteria bacterium GW2011_GWA2_45_90]|uniref:Baseplate protein J-like domain-containing protein n=1 Tax=Candidatus Azambacteria bacterium GW2011_GWA2_45_90 TaxID=1618614 RepID=A0A0G1NGL1_9BACT|nr:MAG: hypothetical protein UX27_C0002G0023 [Candidatus Azambacteria bacterium GW2011_GWA2_45_90]
MSHKTIYIEIDEEITSIIDRIAESEADGLTLAVPKGAKLFQSVVNLKFLKREAEALGKKVVLVTSDAPAAALAEQIGLAVKEKLEFGEDIEPPLSGWPKEREYKRPPLKVYDIIGPGGAMLKNVPSRPKKKAAEEEEVKISITRPEAVIEQKIEKEEKTEEKGGVVKEKVPRKTRKLEEEFLAGIEEAPYAADEEAAARAEEEGEKMKAAKRFKMPSFGNLLLKLSHFWRTKPAAEIEEMEKPTVIAVKRPAFQSSKILILFIAVSLAVISASLYYILPVAKIVIVPKKDKISSESVVIIDKNIPQISGDRIPGQIVQMEESLSREFSASGKTSAAQKAKGIITVYNAFGPNPQTLVATTRFLSETGKLFRLDKTVTVPGAKVVDGKITPSSIDVQVTAGEPGEDFSIGPSDFTIPGFQGTPKYAAFYGKSGAAMAGGSSGAAQIVTKDDIAKAKEEIRKELENRIREELLGKIPSGLKFIEDAVEQKVNEMTANVEAGESAEKFEIKGKITLKALLFKESDIDIWIDQNVSSQIQAGYAPTSGTRAVTYGKPELNLAQGTMKLPFKIEQEIAGKIEVEAFKERISGKDENQIRQIIMQETGIETASVTFWPFWVSKAPASSNRIQVLIQNL